MPSLQRLPIIFERLAIQQRATNAKYGCTWIGKFINLITDGWLINIINSLVLHTCNHFVTRFSFTNSFFGVAVLNGERWTSVEEYTIAYILTEHSGWGPIQQSVTVWQWPTVLLYDEKDKVFALIEQVSNFLCLALMSAENKLRKCRCPRIDDVEDECTQKTVRIRSDYDYGWIPSWTLLPLPMTPSLEFPLRILLQQYDYSHVILGGCWTKEKIRKIKMWIQLT